jgi:AcrR family transcriptional regulator
MSIPSPSPSPSASAPPAAAPTPPIRAPGNPRLRADARRNRQQLVAAARDVFVELGPDAPLDEVARRAGVGIATLYRRFPDRTSLQRAVALDVLARAAEVASRAEAEEADAWRALARYMHGALDLRISAVMPALLGTISFSDDEFRRAREAATTPVLRILAAGQAAGQLRADIDFGDVGLLLVRLARPLPGPFPAELDLRIAHRHLELVLAAFRPPTTHRHELAGPALSLAELQRIGADAAGPTLSTP